VRGHEILEDATGVLDKLAPGLLVEDRACDGEIGGDEVAGVGPERNASMRPSKPCANRQAVSRTAPIESCSSMGTRIFFM